VKFCRAVVGRLNGSDSTTGIQSSDKARNARAQSPRTLKVEWALPLRIFAAAASQSLFGSSLERRGKVTITILRFHHTDSFVGTGMGVISYLVVASAAACFGYLMASVLRSGREQESASQGR